MKIPVFLMAILFSFGLFADTIQMRPLWEEDAHFQQYRCLMMESAVYRLEDISKTLEGEVKKQIDAELKVLKINLGFPSS